MKEHIGQLQVPVHNVELVEIPQAAHEFLHDYAALILGEAAARARLLEQIQISTIAEFGEDVIVVVSLVVLSETNDVGALDQ